MAIMTKAEFSLRMVEVFAEIVRAHPENVSYCAELAITHAEKQGIYIAADVLNDWPSNPVILALCSIYRFLTEKELIPLSNFVIDGNVDRAWEYFRERSQLPDPLRC